jgi:hypothetical protein
VSRRASASAASSRSRPKEPPAPLELQSEQYSALGNLASEGVQNQLGRPKLDPLTVLIRESVQNSWDAHDPTHPHIRYEIDLSRATKEQLDALSGSVFSEVPENMEISRRLREAGSGGPPLNLLILSDRLTSGLGGPTRADVLTEEEGESHDFVDFLRNIGQPPDKPLGGGTYGYGKAALYAVSRHHTILVYTRCRHRGRSERRFFVAGLGAGYTVKRGAKKGRYTGRHWWGRIRGGIVEPLLDEDAKELAEALGFPDFADDEHGTSIAIFDAELGQQQPQEAMAVLQEALLWNFWPKMVTAECPPSITFVCRLDGASVPLSDPMDHPPLEGFVAAMEHLKARRTGVPSRHFGTYEEVWCKSPKRLLGWLSLNRFETRKRRILLHAEASTGALTGNCHNVALMRDAELVVRYLDGPPLQTDRFEYAGVFIASRELDRAFAAAEPPTHDDWIWENLDDKTHRTFVKVAVRNIRDKMKDYAQPTGTRRTAGQVELPLGGLSSSLGSLLTGLTGLGASRPRLDERAEIVPAGPVVEQTEPAEEEPELFPEDEDTDEVVLSPPRPDTPSSPMDEADSEEEEEEGPPEPVEATDEENPETPAARPTPVARTGPRPKPRPAGLTTAEPRLAVLEERGVLELDLHIKHGRNSDGTLLMAQVVAELDGESVENSPPAGAEVPRVLHWRSSSGRICGQGEEKLLVRVGEGTRWTLVLSLAEDVSVRASVDAQPHQDPS